MCQMFHRRGKAKYKPPIHELTTVGAEENIFDYEHRDAAVKEQQTINKKELPQMLFIALETAPSIISFVQ